MESLEPPVAIPGMSKYDGKHIDTVIDDATQHDVRQLGRLDYPNHNESQAPSQFCLSFKCNTCSVQLYLH
jgi:hypothetical protein